MDLIRLIVPGPAQAEAAMDYLREFTEHHVHPHGVGGLNRYEQYADWLEKEEESRAYTQVTPDRVPSSTYFAIREGDGRLVGMVNIRHALNDHLMSFGGHIGYSVRPTEQRKGYATQMLGLALKICAGLGIHRALLTCNTENTASARTIQKHGGVRENTCYEEDGQGVDRYWIDIS